MHEICEGKYLIEGRNTKDKKNCIYLEKMRKYVKWSRICRFKIKG